MLAEPLVQAPNYLDLAFHGLQALTNLAVLKLAFTFHKEWVQIKERLDTIYKEFCKDHGISFIGIGK